MEGCIKKMESKVFRVSKGSRHQAKDTWIWNEEVQNVIRAKKSGIKCYHVRQTMWTFRNIRELKRQKNC